MPGTSVLHILLDPASLAAARRGRAGMIRRIREAFAWRGIATELVEDGKLNRSRAARAGAYRLIHGSAPVAATARTLVLRRQWPGQHWQIEAESDPWTWGVTRTQFDPASVDADAATALAARRRQALFGARVPRRDGFVYMPLDGDLTRAEHGAEVARMIAATRDREPDRRILIGLPAEETADPQAVAAVTEAVRGRPGVRLARGRAKDLLLRCDCVVTRHSPRVLDGYVLHKPAVLFGKAAFHHIAGAVPLVGADRAFEVARGPAPAFDAYLHWFLCDQMLDAAAEDVVPAILARVRTLGWEV